MNLNSKIGLGSVQFGIPYGVSNTTGQTHPEEVAKILRYASENGINYIDTASAYGTSEEVLGTNNLSKFRVVTKFMPQGATDQLKDQLESSLNKLRQSSVYGYLAHRPMDLAENTAQWEQLLAVKAEGKVKKIGFSLNTPVELDVLLDKGMTPDLIQVPFNYFDDRFKLQLIQLKNNGCEVHTRSAFLQGLFFTETHQLHSFFDQLKGEIHNLQNTFADHLSGALLKYVLTRDFIDVVIMGVENQAQLKVNLESIHLQEALEEKQFGFDANLLMPSNWPK